MPTASRSPWRAPARPGPARVARGNHPPGGGGTGGGGPPPGDPPTQAAARRGGPPPRRAADLHPYDVPCVIALPLEGGNPAYLAWIAAETRGA